MNLYNAKNILITGGLGFIGANFLFHLLGKRSNLHIVNLDKMTYASNKLVIPPQYNNRYVFVNGDICDAELIHQLLKEHKIDTILNFAAESHVDRSIQDPLLFAKTNVVGTANLLDAAKRYWLDELKLTEKNCRFYQISTDEVFGSLDFSALPSNEQHAYQPRSPYSASKAGADHFVYAYYHTYGLPIVLSHCSNNYGPFQHAEKFIPTIINACLTWQPISVYGTGQNIRDWIYVEDHCQAILTILENGQCGTAYNVGANNELSNNELVNTVCALMDELFPRKASYSTLISYVTDRLGHDLRYGLDSRKILKELGWKANIPFQDGLIRTIQHLAATPVPSKTVVSRESKTIKE